MEPSTNQIEILSELINQKLEAIKTLETEITELRRMQRSLLEEQQDFKEPLYVFYSDDCDNELPQSILY